MIIPPRLYRCQLLVFVPIYIGSSLLLPYIDAFASRSIIHSLVISQSRLISKSSLNSDSVQESSALSIEDISNDENRKKLQSYYSFPLDKWQLDAGEVLCNGCSCIVCAPTGSGKTVVGEMALQLAFEKGKNAIYTTPLKALSNQKFFELRKMFGAENVGLATGDTSINRGARITVMTTEVYRNMAWRSSSSSVMPENPNKVENDTYDDLSQNLMVVLDEFHYMGQP